ncbi:MAG: response regulator [Defluviitaleaceae bacterium]|nr:response regulator [Defluviitaleaceae bacterium]
MSSNANYYTRVKSLFLPFQTPPEPLNTNINKYIDKIDDYTERLETSFKRDNMTEFMSVLDQIQEMLQSVYAKRQEAYTVTLSRSARGGNTEFSDKVLQQAIADFLLLSIEMQKAQNLPSTSAALNYSDVEKNEDTAHNLSAIVRLIDAGDYEKAKSMVADMKGMGFTVGQLAMTLNAGDYKKAKELAVSMQKESMEKITKVESSPSRGSKTVLAVDDRPEILTQVSNALRNHYKALGAPGGKVAIDIINAHDIDLFILDIDMPEMDGFELARIIRGNRKYEKTPIVFLTANSTRDRIMRAIRLGADDFVVKPAYNEALLTKARKYLG